MIGEILLQESAAHVRVCTATELLSAREPDLADLTYANRFRHRADRTRSIAGRGLLRDIADELGFPMPTKLVPGNPLSDAGAPGLFWSLTHTQSAVCVAVRQGAPIGVDAESLQRDIDWIGIATHLKIEQPCGSRGDFLDWWTSYEAVFKATSAGVRDGIRIEDGGARFRAQTGTGNLMAGNLIRKIWSDLTIAIALPD